MTRGEQIKQAIAHYQYGIKCDIFNEPVKLFPDNCPDICDREYEVIGNIYDNPELLEVKA